MFARILIAEPNDTVRELLKVLVESRPDWSVCGTAKDGQEAVTKAAALKPDLVILDLAMPVLNGLLAARQISAAFPKIPILLHTIHDLPQVIEEAKKYGIREVVGKNEGGENLLRAIEKNLNAQPQSVTDLLGSTKNSAAKVGGMAYQKRSKPN